MRIFVTGGTGFIGTYVVKRLYNDGHELLLLTQGSQPLFCDNFGPRVKRVKGDLSDIHNLRDEFKDFQPDTTVHLAWEGIPNYGYKISTKNLIYGLNLVSLLAELGCKRFIATGSCWEYGQQQGQISEETMPKPSNAFTAAKIALYWMGKEIAEENNMQFIWVRLFYVYGPGQRKQSLIPYIVNCIQKGRRPDIKTISAKNDFVYVEDVAMAIGMLVKYCNQSAIYNIGSGYSTAVKDIIKIICAIYNFSCDFTFVNSTNETLVNFWADISGIKKDIGWQPKMDINEGIQRTIDYYATASR